jgi:hypothetical protein
LVEYSMCNSTVAKQALNEDHLIEIRKRPILGLRQGWRVYGKKGPMHKTVMRIDKRNIERLLDSPTFQPATLHECRLVCIRVPFKIPITVPLEGPI